MRIYIKVFAIVIGVFMANMNLLGQDHEYHIDFQVSGWADTTVYLGYYYGESTYLKDTAKVNSEGQFIFEGNSQLNFGVYFLVMNTTKLFEFLIGENQQFSIQTDASSYVENLAVEGDRENSLFFDNLRYIGAMNKKAQPFVQQLNDSLETVQEKTNARKSLQRIGEQVKSFHDSIISNNQGTVIATILLSQQKLEIPEELKDDSQGRFAYYKEHYWDNYDLGNDVLIRTPDGSYRKKIDEYLDNLFSQHPDSLIKAVSNVVNQAKSNPETYKYAVWNLCLKYQNPKIMGQDEVFVYLYDTYFASGEMDFWANQSLKNNLKERADQLRKSLVGNKAPNMILLDDQLKQVSLYGIPNKYTVIYFYDPDCGHCKKETPKLKDFYTTTKHDVEVFAVCADTSMVKMKNYIKDFGLTWVSANGPRTITPHYQTMYDANTTPTIYVLDEKKKIIAKKLEAVRLEEFLDNYEKNKP